MTITPRCLRAGAACILFATAVPAAARAQAVDIPLTPDAWVASDSLRFVPFLGRPSLYINRGVALARGASMENGVLEMDLAASEATSFLGVAFRSVTPQFTNVMFLRPRSSGTEDAVQYGPAFNSLGVAWQVYHGAGANAVAVLQRNRWIHVRVELNGPVARLFLDSAATPTLVVPRVVTSGGNAVGVWTGAFGRGAYFSNVRYTAMQGSAAPTPAPVLAAGTITSWDLSNSIEAADFSPTTLPDLRRLTWQPVQVEPEGFVLVNRYREAPVGSTPTDSTGAVLIDSVMTGKMAGSRIVYARATITAARDELRLLHYTYCNGVVIYLNGRPLVMAMNPSGVRAPLGAMAPAGDAVYLPLKRGRNEIVFAVVELTGGWAFSARLP